MKSLDLRILIALFHDVEQHLPVKLSKDRERVIDRVRSEGFEFLTITLPSLDDALLEGLSRGTLPRLRGWKYRAGVPEFLSPLWRRIFDETGSLNPSPCKESILYLRQVSRMFKKQFLVCDDHRVNEAVARFKSVDSELPDGSFEFDRSLRMVARYAFPEILYSSFDELEFSHGPGATAEKLDSVQRWDFSHVPSGFFELFGVDSVCPNYSSFLASPPAEFSAFGRLCAVPKTATKPRLISIEPATSMYLQQGLKALMEKELARHWSTNLLDQYPNQEMARIGSVSGSFATIDLSDASDRLSLALARSILGDTPLWEYLWVTRTKGVELPDGALFLLKKFASMGSAVTFPVQILVFATIVIRVLLDALPITRENVLKVLNSRQFRVYGDDIIVPTDAAGRVMDALEACGLKVNTSKSFSSGAFRESCGADWYDGFNVTPIYSRKPASRGLTDESIVSLVSLRNQLHSTYRYPRAVAVIDDSISWMRLSTHDCRRECVVGTLCGDQATNTSWNPALQRTEYRRLALRERRVRVNASDKAKLHFALARLEQPETVVKPFQSWWRDVLAHVDARPTSWDPIQYDSRPQGLRPYLSGGRKSGG